MDIATMEENCMAYLSLKDRLRILEEQWKAHGQSRIELLNRHADLAARLHPLHLEVVDVNPELDKQAKAELAACDRHHEAHGIIRSLKFAALRIALTSIGSRYGAMMKLAVQGSVGVRFSSNWELANAYRLAFLDGRSMGKLWDKDGPMFIAFSKAAGYSKPNELANDLVLEQGMRSGETPITLDAAKRLGIIEDTCLQ